MSASKDNEGFERPITANIHASRLDDPEDPEENLITPSSAEMKAHRSDDEMGAGGFIPEEQSEGGGFFPEDAVDERSNDSDDFVYEDEDGIL